MAQILSPLIKLGWLKNYLDYLIIFGPDFNTLIERLGTLFDLLMEKGLKVNLSKCSFAQSEVKFLGHIISKEGF